MTLGLLAAVAKLLVYAGALCGAGAALAGESLRSELDGAGERRARRLAASGALLTVGSALAGAVLLLVRLGGGFDAFILSAVFAGPLGLALGAQVAGGALLLAVRRREEARSVRLVASALLLGSFGIVGHSPSMVAGGGLLATVHVAAASWWLGGLLLLRQACRPLGSEELAALARRFSRLALFVVGGGLVASGALLVFVLVPLSWAAWTTPYSQNLGLKLALAACALGLAHFNRTRILPRLAAGRPDTARALRRAVTVEIALLACVLAVTAWLTTFQSPHSLHAH